MHIRPLSIFGCHASSKEEALCMKAKAQCDMRFEYRFTCMEYEIFLIDIRSPLNYNLRLHVG